ncbi:MAG: TonB-dependent receptor, partial [Sphingobacteriaceae bacterium]
FRSSPLVVPYDASGNLIPYPTNTTFSNPFLGYTTDDYDRHNYFFANLYSEISVPHIKGLTYRINFGQNYRLDLHNTSSIYDAGLTGQASKEITTYYDYTFDNIVTYNRTLKKHDLTATLLYGSVQRKYDYTRAYSNVFSRLTLGYNSLQQGTNRYAVSNAYKEALEYQMARINYGYDSRYLITATVRRDGFSGFAENNKYGIFPSLGLGWIATNESFFKPNWLNYLKVRASYGEIGNQTSRYASLSTLGSGASYVFGDGGSTLFGQQVNSLPNPDLRWERTSGTNAGLDFTLFSGVLTGVFEYYNTKTTDLLYNVNIPTVTGFNTISTNIGQINNQGTELSLTSKNFDTKIFKW